nr:hypothetical protein [Candidatus Thiosymbion oneisti]
MFDQTGTLTHLLWPLIGHPLPLGLNQRRVLTAVNAVHAAGVGPAHRLQRAGSALTGRAAVAGAPSAVLLMRLTARGEQLAGGQMSTSRVRLYENRSPLRRPWPVTAWC